MYVFDGNDAIFPAWNWRIQHQLAMLKLIHCLKLTPEEENYANPVKGESEEEGKVRDERYKKRLEQDIKAMQRRQ